MATHEVYVTKDANGRPVPILDRTDISGSVSNDISVGLCFK